MTSIEIADAIEEKIPEMDACQRIDDIREDYLDDGWEDEYDDMDEAYSETGRGAAESQILNEIVNAYKAEHCPDMTDDQWLDIFQELKDRWALSTD